MAYGLPPFLLGKNVSVAITPQSVAADGTLSNNAIGALTFNGRIEDSAHGLEYSTENISPNDFISSNPVPIEMGTSFSITEIAQAWPLWTSASAVYGQGNTIEKAARLSPYHLLNITASKRDNSASIMTWSAYVLMTGYGRSSPKGKNTFTANFQTILIVDTSTGVEQSNPSVGT